MDGEKFECPNQWTPVPVYCARDDKYYDQSVMCRESDKYCLREYGQPCELYDELKKEAEQQAMASMTE